MKPKNVQAAHSVPQTNRREIVIRYGAAFLFLLLFVATLVWLNSPAPGEVPTSASLRTYVPARVVEIISDNAQADTWTEGLRIGSQELNIKLLSGEYKGKILSTPNYLTAYFNVDVGVGGRIIVQLDKDEQGAPYVVQILNHDRGLVLGGLLLLFAVLLVIIGGIKGLKALLGLIFTLVALWFLLIPMIMRGFSPIPATVLLVALTAAVSLLLLNGLSIKTLCATLGCVGGVAVAGIATAIVGVLTPIGGFNMAEAEDLILRGANDGMTIRGLLVCGVLIAALGAVMDVAMTITSALHELHTLNPKLNRTQLFKSGMNIGKDAMGTMANTLILAFAGSSLNVLILFRVFDYPFLQIANSDLMAIELIQGVAGSLGIILTVPLVAFISAEVMGRSLPHRRSAVKS